MNDEEKKVVCQSCDKHIPVIHLDVCSAVEPAKLIETLLTEDCPLEKWNNGNQL
jgi:hypothetical protein